MAADRSLLEETTGYIGVGSIELLGLLAGFDSITQFYELVKVYMGTAALFAIPCLALSYLLGMLTVAAWSQVNAKKSPLTPTLFRKLIDSKAEHLIARFCEAERQSKLIGASTISLAILGLGLISEVVQAAQFKIVAITSGGMLFILCIACSWLATQVLRDAADFIAKSLPSVDA